MDTITIKVYDNWNDHTARVYTYDGWGDNVAEIYRLENGYLALINSASTGFRRKWHNQSGRLVMYVENCIRQLFPFKKVEFVNA